MFASPCVPRTSYLTSSFPLSLSTPFNPPTLSRCTFFPHQPPCAVFFFSYSPTTVTRVGSIGAPFSYFLDSFPLLSSFRRPPTAFFLLLLPRFTFSFFFSFQYSLHPHAACHMDFCEPLIVESSRDWRSDEDLANVIVACNTEGIFF